MTRGMGEWLQSHKGSFLPVAILISAIGPSMANAACDQTLSPGANVANAVANAAAGTTICLNAGSYGYQAIISVSKTSPVIIQSTSGRTANIDLAVDQSKNLTFQNLTLVSVSMWSRPSFNIKFLNNTFTGQAMIRGTGSSATPANILIDGNTFDGISACANCYEGRLQLTDAGGITVSNNHFGGGGESDGIQWSGYGGVVGPGNVFEGILQGSYGRHIDAIQLYGDVSHHTIVGNFFRGNSTCIMAPDGGEYVTITDNVFVGNNVDYGEIQLGSQLSPTFTHNTVIGMAVGFNKKSELPNASANALVRDNIFMTRARLGVECTNCTFTHNMWDSTSQPYGTSNISGAPTFSGGAKPSSWSGYQLASTSIGYKSATDGKDMGATYFGSGTVVVPPVSTTPTPTPVPATPTPAPTTAWKFCANEGGQCLFVGASQVRYGANGVYITKTSTGSTPCTNDVFGDPVYGVAKVCEVPAATVLVSATPSPTPAPPAATAQRLFSSQVPAQLVNTDGVNYELGMKFRSTVAGSITHIRFYKSASESGTHAGKIYSSTGALLAQVAFANETASGWQEAKLATPIAINANTTYTVSVNTGNKAYVTTVGGMASQISSGNLRSVVGNNGVFGPVGQRPTQSWNNSNYFRDIVFVPK